MKLKFLLNFVSSLSDWGWVYKVRHCDHTIRSIYLRFNFLNTKDINKHRDIQQSDYILMIRAKNPCFKTFNCRNCGERVDRFWGYIVKYWLGRESASQLRAGNNFVSCSAYPKVSKNTHPIGSWGGGCTVKASPWATNCLFACWTAT